MPINYDDFSYEKVSSGILKSIPHENIEFVPQQDGMFAVLSHKRQAQGGHEHGWKFSISIDDAKGDNEEFSVNLAQAWDLIIPIFFERGISRIKVALKPLATRTGKLQAPNDCRATLPGVEAGKQITIYASMDNKEPSEWQEILQQITTLFMENNIKPSCCPIGSHKLGNNPYISYRNDAQENGKYQYPKVNGLLKKDAPNSKLVFNIGEKDGPYSKLVFDIGEDRPKRPYWEAVVGEEAVKAVMAFIQYNQVSNSPTTNDLPISEEAESSEYTSTSDSTDTSESTEESGSNSDKSSTSTDNHDNIESPATSMKILRPEREDLKVALRIVVPPREQVDVSNVDIPESRARKLT